MATSTFKSIYDEAVIFTVATLDYSFLNRALRWIWRTDDPLFAWPETVTSSANITITDGVIAWSAVSNSDWCSFWESDPSVYAATPSEVVSPVPVTWDGTQFRTQSHTVTSPCFAYYRTAVPQGTSATDTTTLIPLQMRDILIERVVYLFNRRISSMGAANDAAMNAQMLLEGRKSAILNANSRLPWEGNINIVQF